MRMPGHRPARNAQELHRVRSGTFSPRGRATSPITGMAVTPETAWQHSPFEQGSYATEGVRVQTGSDAGLGRVCLFCPPPTAHQLPSGRQCLPPNRLSNHQHRL